jgi:hypothetical protein
LLVICQTFHSISNSWIVFLSDTPFCREIKGLQQDLKGWLDDNSSWWN